MTSPTHAQHIKLDKLALSQPHTLILGVSGHRDILEKVGNINQLELVKDRLWSQLEYLAKEYSLENIDLYTPLARGTDRLVNEVCASFCEFSQINFTQHAVLPFDKEVYISYEEKDHQPALRELLDNAHHITIPEACTQAYDDALKNNKDQDNAEDDAKHLALRALGDFYAGACDLMICLWDGVHNHATGGTADVIYHIRGLARSKTHYKDFRCKGLLCLTVAREKNPFPSHEPLTWHHFAFLSREKGLWEKFVKAYHILESKRSLVLFFLAISTVIFGLIGYCGAACRDWVEALIISFSHLTLSSLDFSASQTQHNGWVLWSRGTGLVFFIIAAKAILDHLVLANTRFRCFINANFSHDLICGLGWRGQALLENQGNHSIRTTAIDIQPDKVAAGACSHSNTPLLTDDASNWDILKKTGLNNTRQAFICTGSDEINMSVVHQIASQYKTGGGLLRRNIAKIPYFKQFVSRSLDQRLVCTVALFSRENFPALINSLPQGHQIDLRMFHTETSTARMFMRNNHIDRFTCSPDAKGARVVIIGDCTMADVLMHQNITQGIFEEGKKLEIIRVLSNAQDEASKFVKAYPAYKIASEQNDAEKKRSKKDTHRPDLDYVRITAREAIWKEELVLPDITMYEMPSSQREFVDWAQFYLSTSEWVLNIIVAQEDPAISSTTAARLAPVLEGIRVEWSPEKASIEHKCDVALWFLFNTPNESMRASIEQTLDSLEGNKHLHIRAFSDFLGISNRSIATGGEADAIAQRVNIAWDDKDVLKGTSDRQVLSERRDYIRKRWNDASFTDKDSSRQCAEHCFLKQRIRNRAIIGSDLSEEEANHLLAPIEHRRWCADHLMQGYEPLTRIPSAQNNPKKFIVNDKEQSIVRAWFKGDKKDKDLFKTKNKQQLKHIDLIPFKDFDLLFDEEIAKAEKGKDSAIVDHLDEIMRTEEFDNLKDY